MSDGIDIRATLGTHFAVMREGKPPEELAQDLLDIIFWGFYAKRPVRTLGSDRLFERARCVAQVRASQKLKSHQVHPVDRVMIVAEVSRAAVHSEQPPPAPPVPIMM